MRAGKKHVHMLGCSVLSNTAERRTKQTGSQIQNQKLTGWDRESFPENIKLIPASRSLHLLGKVYAPTLPWLAPLSPSQRGFPDHPSEGTSPLPSITSPSCTIFTVFVTLWNDLNMFTCLVPNSSTRVFAVWSQELWVFCSLLLHQGPWECLTHSRGTKKFGWTNNWTLNWAMKNEWELLR